MMFRYQVYSITDDPNSYAKRRVNLRSIDEPPNKIAPELVMIVSDPKFKDNLTRGVVIEITVPDSPEPERT